MTGWRKIKEIMEQADIKGPHASPKGLRHGFGVHAIAHCEIPLNMVQKWLGHSDLKTTAIYANAVGKQERDIANKCGERKLNNPLIKCYIGCIGLIRFINKLALIRNEK